MWGAHTPFRNKINDCFAGWGFEHEVFERRRS